MKDPIRDLFKQCLNPSMSTKE